MKTRATRTAWLVLLTALPACSDWQLVRNIEVIKPVYDNKLALTGEICTSDPSEIEFPLKVLFVVDSSQSMDINDPVDRAQMDTTLGTNRSRALREVITQFIDLGVQFAPTYCNTGDAGCDKGSTSCPACGADAMCVGPDCCSNPPCAMVPACPGAGQFNASCLPLCDATQPGCGPDEKGCPDCPSAEDRCLNGICAKTLDPGVEFAIMRFGGGKETLTNNPDGDPGFTSDPGELVTALPQVGVATSVTDYEGALSEAFNILSRDMAKMRQTRAGAVNRAKYVVVFLTDGQPDPRINEEDDWDSIPQELQQDLLGSDLDPSAITEYNIPSRVLQRVKDIVRLKALHRIAEIRFHTAYLAGNAPSWTQEQAVNLLKQMARVGGGTFRNFQNGEDINFLHVDFSSLRRVFRMKNLIATNLNGQPAGSETLTDSDGDSLSDSRERLAGTSAASLDSDSDGFSDTVEHFFRTSGWDPLDNRDADCPMAAYDADLDGLLDDADGDGLLDCEERFLGTSRDLFDSDADGIPDNVEVRFGTNPVANDLQNDLDFDGMPNGDEIRLHTDPRADDAAVRSRTSYRYDVQRIGTGLEMVGIPCNSSDDCPQQNDCLQNYCRCLGDDLCSTLATCTDDEECTFPGETCDDTGQCRSAMTCQQVPTFGGGDQRSCAVQKSITCYSFSIENIALVMPKGNARDKEDGWNTVYLYFGEVPFDNPNDFGNYRTACVRARYLDETAPEEQRGQKLPATGELVLPPSAWNRPQDLDPRTDCLCPDGEVGTCPENP